MDTRLAYNRVIGKHILWKLGAVTSIRYLVMKIPTQEKVIIIKGDQEVAKQCHSFTIKDELEAFPIKLFGDVEKHGVNPEPIDEV